MHAVQELSTTDKNIDEIAIDSGFSNSHAFVTFFKKQYGMLPKDYRREQKKKKEKPSWFNVRSDFSCSGKIS